MASTFTAVAPVSSATMVASSFAVGLLLTALATFEEAVSVAAPPVPVSASAYEAVTVSPCATFSGGALFAPATTEPDVVRGPEKMPVLPPVSVSVTVSLSLVRVLMTVTWTVCTEVASVSRSGSLTPIVSVSPGATSGVMLIAPVDPSVAASVTSSAVDPSASKPTTASELLVTFSSFW